MKIAQPLCFIVGLATTLLLLSYSPVMGGERVLPGKLGDYGKYFNPKAVEIFSGKVLEVYQQPYSRKYSQCCTAIRVERDDREGDAVVYLGPKSRLDKEGFTIEPGEDVCILGSATVIEGQNIIIAQQLNMGNYVIALRNETGRQFATYSVELDNSNEDACLLAYIQH